MTGVLHLPFTYLPDPPGGTEVYVAALARELRAFGIASVVAAPTSEAAPYSGDVDGVRVYRYPVSGGETRSARLRESYGAADVVAAAHIEDVLERESPDVLHMHAFTAGPSLLAAGAARRRGIPVVFTYHTPTATCIRGTLLLEGREICDGEMLVDRCAACVLQSQGVPVSLGRALAHVPPAVGRALDRVDLAGGPWTALRMTELTAMRHESFRALVDECDAVVAVSQWVRELLLLNRVPAEKLAFSRQGVAAPLESGRGARPASPLADGRGVPVRLAFLGRLEPVKGLHVVLDAMQLMPGADVRLDVYGVEQRGGGGQYAAALRELAAADGRVSFREALAPARVVDALAAYDAVVVPSLTLETGPLVVLEAFAAGAFVVGSRRGGVAELVRDEVDGLLVEPESPVAWSRALDRVAADPALRARLRSGVRPPRSMADVARDMAELYSRLTSRRAAPRDTLAAGLLASRDP